MTAAPHNDRFPALEGLRAVGALMVLLTHVGFQSGDAVRGPVAGWLARLDAGVALFFVVSGFLLFRPFVLAKIDDRAVPSVPTYLWHRAIRILPVLWTAVLLCALLVPTRGARALDYLQVATLVQIYADAPLLHGLTQMWSLSTEVAFYLILPVLGRVLLIGGGGRAWALRTILICGLLLIGSAAWMAGMTAAGQAEARVWLSGYLGWFGCGMALAVWQVARAHGIFGRCGIDAVLEHPGTVWALALACYGIVTSTLAGPYDLLEPTAGQAAIKNLLYAVVGVLAVAPGVIAPGPTNSAALGVLSGPIGSFLGRISYGIFAYHVGILVLVEQWLDLATFDGNFVLRLLVTLPVSVLVATISFYAMERPILRWGRRLRRPTQAHRRPPALVS